MWLPSFSLPYPRSARAGNTDRLGRACRERVILLTAVLLAACGPTYPGTESSEPLPPPLPPAGPLQPSHGDAGTQVAATVVLTQLDVEFDGETHANTAWGHATVDYTGVFGVLYFNLVIDGTWRVQNIPFLSPEGAGVTQTNAVTFDLGVAQGTEVTSVDAIAELSIDPLTEAPAGGAVTTAVGNQAFVIATGFSRKTIAFAPPAPTLVGGAADGPKATNPNFPNQEAGKNECVPAALSNSLRWLDGTYGLGIAEGNMSIAAMKVLVKWGPDGAPQQWWSRKRSFFKELIETTTIPKNSLDKVFDAVRNGCDVEMRANNHVVAVTGAQKLADGNYVLELTHDTVQGDDTKGTGKTGTQNVTWDVKTKKFSGAPWIEGHGPDLFVSECPKRRT